MKSNLAPGSNPGGDACFHISILGIARTDAPKSSQTYYAYFRTIHRPYKASPDFSK